MMVERDRGSSEPNVRCWQCGYSLRSIAASGLCPECGAPIEDTLEIAREAAARARRRTENRLWRGGRFPLWLVLAFGFIAGAGIAAGAVCGVVYFDFVGTAAVVIGFGAFTLMLVGASGVVWMAAAGSSSHRSQRVRVAFVALLAWYAACTVASVLVLVLVLAAEPWEL